VLNDIAGRAHRERMEDILTGTNPGVVPSFELMQKLKALRPR
jgi:hypothetical protein